MSENEEKLPKQDKKSQYLQTQVKHKYNNKLKGLTPSTKSKATEAEPQKESLQCGRC